jgi:hypothetical protein
LELWVEELCVEELWVEELGVEELWVEELWVEDRWPPGPALEPSPTLATTRPATAPMISMPRMAVAKANPFRVDEVSTSFCPGAGCICGSCL